MFLYELGERGGDLQRRREVMLRIGGIAGNAAKFNLEPFSEPSAGADCGQGPLQRIDSSPERSSVSLNLASSAPKTLARTPWVS